MELKVVSNIKRKLQKSVSGKCTKSGPATDANKMGLGFWVFLLVCRMSSERNAPKILLA